MAASVGVVNLALSLTHEGGFAAAVVVAECRDIEAAGNSGGTSGQAGHFGLSD
jgi:hypothetical protein